MSDTALIALSMGAVLAATVFTEIGTVKMLAAGVGGGVVTAAKKKHDQGQRPTAC